jgi:hypothetical protein
MRRFLSIFFCVALLVSVSPAQSLIARHPEVAGAIKVLEAWIETGESYTFQLR